jgi:hypothetical protein
VPVASNSGHRRRLGLPISSAAVEIPIKQINRRMQGTEQFWLQGGAEGAARGAGSVLVHPAEARARDEKADMLIPFGVA